jgi:hypothetical protein
MEAKKEIIRLDSSIWIDLDFGVRFLKVGHYGVHHHFSWHLLDLYNPMSRN